MPADTRDGPFKEDGDGQYLVCSAFHIDPETDDGRYCGGKQRPQTPHRDTRQWICEDCGATTFQRVGTPRGEA